MLYNRNAVKNRIPVTKDQIMWARRFPFFKISAELRCSFERGIKKGSNNLRNILNTIAKISRQVSYDYDHRHEGIRTASEVFKDKTGHCIEQNILLYSVLRSLGIFTRWTVFKNPKGYSISLEDAGFHPLLRFEQRGEIYFADQVSNGVVRQDSRFRYATRQDISLREFSSFCLLDGGDDCLQHRKYKKSKIWFTGSLVLDPNNYPVYFSEAEAELQEGNLRKAKELCRKGIRIAPDLLDCYDGYGDLLFRAGEIDSAIRQYKKAVSKETPDVQVLYSLSRRLKYLGEKKLREQVCHNLEEKLGGENPDYWTGKSGKWIYI
ncbi:MAG: transglutaminase domain-containing protein [Nanoarchaeota archaeon]|nr:transglutaminase domain-containing protein [Nanoarchaeota archaeon]